MESTQTQTSRRSPLDVSEYRKMLREIGGHLKREAVVEFGSRHATTSPDDDIPGYPIGPTTRLRACVSNSN